MSLKQEREQMFLDLADGKVPKRVPVYMSFEASYPILYAGYNLAVDQYNPDIVKDAIDKTLTDFDSDNMPASVGSSAVTNKIYGSRKFIPSDSGFFQHPNITAMESDEYDEFIEDPYKFIYEKVTPRLYTNMTPEKRGETLFKANLANQYLARRSGGMNAELAEKHQRSTACPMLGSLGAPFDVIGDNLRSFTDCLSDIRRYPSKVLDALDVITSMQVSMLDSMPKQPPKGAKIFSALHMPTFMRTKDFEKFWWPTYLEMSNAIVEHDYTHLMFCEDDWNRFADHLTDLPKNNKCILNFEYMDAKLAKDTLGKDYILAGFYSLGTFASKTPDECVDEAKRVLDIMAPGGNYMFRTDKAPIMDTDLNMDGYKAVVKYVMNNTDYN